MSDLGDVLAALHDSDNRWHSLTASVKAWHHRDRLLHAIDRFNRTRGGMPPTPPGVPWRTPDSEPAGRSATGRLWAMPHQRLRVELEPNVDGQPALHLIVIRGNDFWTKDTNDKVLTNQDQSPPRIVRGIGSPYVSMMNPASLLGQFRVADATPAHRAGDDGWAIELIARPDATSPMQPPLIYWGVTAYRAHVHSRGVITSIEGRVDDEAAIRVDLDDISFDGDVADELFLFVPPPGARTVPQTLELQHPADAARVVPFTVFVPERRRGEAPWVATVLPAEVDRGPRISIHLLGVTSPAVSITESDDVAHMPETSGWTPGVIGGINGHVYQHGDDGGFEFVCTRDATRIWLRGKDQATVTAAVSVLRPITAS